MSFPDFLNDLLIFPQVHMVRGKVTPRCNSSEIPVACVPPLMVLMTITPLAPRTPYMAVCEGSFKTLTDAMSLGLIELILPLRGTPSTTYKGLLAFMEPMPRMRTIAPPPGELSFPMVTPDTWPCSFWLTDAAFTWLSV